MKFSELLIENDARLCGVYEAERKTDINTKESKATLAAPPAPHALSSQDRVPVHVMETADTMWLGDRVLLSCITHLNKLNALNWGLFMACLSLMYVIGDELENIEAKEWGYLALTSDAQIGYLEPSGVSFEIAKDHWPPNGRKPTARCIYSPLEDDLEVSLNHSLDCLAPSSSIYYSRVG
jgi:hypothetical protein